ncbi:hypothetical protein F4703DRAFT_1931064 [Phycomyces blakesleeanus]
MNNNRLATATVTITSTPTPATSKTTRQTTDSKVYGVRSDKRDIALVKCLIAKYPENLPCGEVISAWDEIQDLVNAADKDLKSISMPTVRRRYTQFVGNHQARQRQERRITGAYEKFSVLEQLLTDLMEVEDKFEFAEAEREKKKELETSRRLQKESVVKDRATMFRIIVTDINSARKRQKTTNTASTHVASGSSLFASLVPPSHVALITSISRHAVAMPSIAMDCVERIVYIFNKGPSILLEKVEDDKVLGAINRLEVKVDNKITVIYDEIQTVNKQIETMEKNLTKKIDMQSQLIQALL